MLGNGICFGIHPARPVKTMPGLSSIFLKIYSFFCGLGVHQLHFLLEKGFVTTLAMKHQHPLKIKMSYRLVLYLKP